MINNLISVIPGVNYPGSVKDVELKEVINAIRTGSLFGRDLIGLTNKIQSISNHNQQNILKERTLPLALYNGTFSYKNNSGLKLYSSFTALDFDRFPDKATMDSVRSSLANNPYVYVVFTSPSGKGLKAIVMHDNTDPQYHRELYQQLLTGFSGCLYLDLSVKDISRGHFICYDPAVMINKNVRPYHFVHDPHYIPKTSPTRTNNANLPSLANMRLICGFKAWAVGQGISDQGISDQSISDQSIINILNSCWKKKPERWSKGNRSNSIFSSASDFCKAGVHIDNALNYLISEYGQTGKSIESIRYQALRGYQLNMGRFGSTRQFFVDYGSGNNG